MQITRLMVPQNKWNIKCPFEMNPDGITIHNTANKASAMAEVSYMVGNDNKVSFHYAIDDYRIVQGIEENRNAFHAGDGRNGYGNRNKIAIEICHSTNPDSTKFSNSEKLAAKFIAYKLKEKGWGIDRVSKHQDFSGKYCPHKTLDLGWERFLNLVRAELNKLNACIVIKYCVYEVTTDSLNIRSESNANSQILGQFGKGNKIAVFELDGDWGRTDKGWINLNYTTWKTYKVYEVTADSLNIRKTPEIKNGNIVGKFSKGNKVAVFEEKKGWGRTDKGWIFLEYVK